MALGMKTWSVIVAGLLAAVLWTLLPPRTYDEVAARWGRANLPVRSPEEQHRNRLTDAVRRDNMRLQTLRWADSLPRLAAAHGTDGVYLGMPSDDTPEEQRARIRDLVAQEIPVDAEGEAAVGVFFLASGQSGHHGVPTSRLEGYYFGEADDGTPYCVVARSGGGPPGDTRLALPYGLARGVQSLTGLCRWMHRYGIPQGEMRDWIEGRGAAAGAAVTPFDGNPSAFDSEEIEVERRGAFGLPGGLGLYLMGRFGLVMEPTRDRCLAGLAEACLDLALHGDRELARITFLEDAANRRRTTAFDAVDVWVSWRQDAFLLSTLEEEFGEDRFRTFWGSDAPVPEAFEAAFGEPMDAWLLGWYGEHTSVTPPGPMPRLAGMLGTLAVLVLSGLLATWFVRRWKVVE